MHAFDGQTDGQNLNFYGRHRHSHRHSPVCSWTLILRRPISILSNLSYSSYLYSRNAWTFYCSMEHAWLQLLVHFRLKTFINAGINHKDWQSLTWLLGGECELVEQSDSELVQFGLNSRNWTSSLSLYFTNSHSKSKLSDCQSFWFVPALNNVSSP